MHVPCAVHTVTHVHVLCMYTVQKAASIRVMLLYRSCFYTRYYSINRDVARGKYFYYLLMGSWGGVNTCLWGAGVNIYVWGWERGGGDGVNTCLWGAGVILTYVDGGGGGGVNTKYCSWEMWGRGLG